MSTVPQQSSMMCDHCDEIITFNPLHAGRKELCPRCGEVVTYRDAATAANTIRPIRIEKKRRGLWKWAAGSFLLLLVLVSVFGPDPGPRVLSDKELIGFAEKGILNVLKSPATAKFENHYVSRFGDGKFAKVVGHVDSQNGFGALIRSDYSVVYFLRPDLLMADPVAVTFAGEEQVYKPVYYAEYEAIPAAD